VRNYQARNFMRDDMRVGDRAFFYHSSCPEPGIAGIVEISRLAYPDATQFDPKSDYYDPKSTRDAPRWVNVDVKLVRKTPLVSVQTLRETKGLQDMVTLRRGNRLSITPVTAAEWKIIEKLAPASVTSVASQVYWPDTVRASSTRYEASASRPWLSAAPRL